MNIMASLKAAGAAIGRCLKKYPANLYLAVGGLMTTTAVVWALIWIITWQIPNGTGNEVLLAKVNNLAYALFGALGIMGIGIVGLFMLAKAFHHLKIAAGNNSIDIGSGPDVEEPVTDDIVGPRP